ncbi:2-succinylbenzoate--CoA ligase [bioreactor metagenome]|uniref:2-succinylbenzoate--CoA ligase n=1 Tax=bioreactor metagenome TaxID=1076179 RepID=A0A644W2H7_9ZZZZ
MELTLIRKIKQQSSHRPAVITDAGKSYTYGQLLDGVYALSAVQEPRTLVFCLCSNTIGSLMGYLACLFAGAVPLLLDRKLDTDMLKALIRRYQPSGLWVPYEMVDGILSGYHAAAKREGYVFLITGNPRYSIHADLALLLTTSGSTGSPKLVRQSMKNITANAFSIAKYLKLDHSERPITTLPMHYTYGLSVIHSHLFAGGTLLLTDHSVMEQEFWDFFEAYGATSLAGVPATYDILNRVGFFERELTTLRYFTQAGGKLSLSMHQKCAAFAKQKRLRFYAMYGQTEATARMAYLPWQRSLEKCGSIGVPIPGGAFSLIDENENEIEIAGKTGELVYRGDNVTLGNAEGPADLAKGDERHGILHTGDLARKDEDGYYYIVGRLKRFLKMAGNRVNLDECEQMVKEAFPSADCACCGTDDRLMVFVTLDESKLDDVKRELSGKLRLPLSSIAAVHISEIPRSSAGKILYPELEAGNVNSRLMQHV